MERSEKVKKYSEAIYLYGFITLCYMINAYEEEQDFKECAIILEALNETNSAKNLNLPTKFDDKAIEYFKRAISEIGSPENPLTGETTISNLPYYAGMVDRMVNPEYPIHYAFTTYKIC